MPAAALSTVRVLVIEDDPNLLNLVTNAIAPSHRVTPCPSARAALALLEAGDRFDVLVTALHLLDMNVAELLERVGEADPLLVRNDAQGNLMRGPAVQLLPHFAVTEDASGQLTAHTDQIVPSSARVAA